MNKKTALLHRIIVPLGVVLLLCTAWTIALNTNFANAETRTVTPTEPEPVYIEVEKTVYVEVEKIVTVIETIEVDRPVFIEKIKEVPRDVPVALKDWDSREQLIEFLKNDDSDRYIILNMDDAGKAAFNGQCEDLAIQLRDRAMAAGRYLSIQVLNPKEYEKWYGQPVAGVVYHAICMARIGNEFWYIEPSNDKCWLALYLD
jgi:hypothetical protein